MRSTVPGRADGGPARCCEMEDEAAVAVQLQFHPVPKWRRNRSGLCSALVDKVRVSRMVTLLAESTVQVGCPALVG